MSRWLAILAAAALVASACGASVSDPATSPSTSAVTTTIATTTTEPAPIAPSLADLAEPGPFGVGVRTIVDESATVEVWYPTEQGSATESYDLRDFTPEIIRNLLAADADSVFTYAATREAPVAGDALGLVLFSHGFAGMRLQSTTITTHLASHGFVVAAPDHPSRDLFNVLGTSATGDRDAPVAELLAARALVLDDPELGPLAGENFAAIGHSAGGGTVLSLAGRGEPDLLGYISLAAGASDAAMPNVPSLFIAGSLDRIAVPEAAETAHSSAPPPSTLWVIDGAGHNAFDDFCLVGGGTGIIGVAVASGLGPLLDAQPQLRALGEDGCLPPALDVALTAPVINAAITAQVLSWLDQPAPSLDAWPGDGVSVEVSTR
ncbi:MAG: alpha/beta hydrolase family protein [Ilumatobacteraceae bacterium]